MFRRRRADTGQPGDGPAGAETGPGDWETGPGDWEASPGEAGPGAGLAGPWDADQDVPGQERIDFGSLLVPTGEGIEVQVSLVENQPAWVTVMHGDSGLQLQAFAAPKSGGLWDEVRTEIADEIVKSGGECRAEEGPFGTELHARVRTEEPGQRTQTQPVRFLGVDGPRWFLRGVISGPAARCAELARPLEEVFASVVVVRGERPVPPRDLLEIRLPDEALQALGQQPPEPEEGRWPLNPFERGPEITETR